MPVFLSDPPPSLFLILGVLTVIALAVAAIRRTRKPAVAFAVLFVVTAVLLACDRLSESPREAATRTMLAFATATQNKRPDAAVSHLAESFTYKGMKKAEVRSLLADMDRLSGWSGAVLTDFDHADAEMLAPDTVRIGFVSRPLNIPSPDYIFYTKATLQKQGNDWKLTAIEFRPDNKRDGPEVDVASFRR